MALRNLLDSNKKCIYIFRYLLQLVRWRIWTRWKEYKNYVKREHPPPSGWPGTRPLSTLLLLGLSGNRTACYCTSPTISRCIHKKGRWWGSQESLDCLWLQYRFYTAPRKRELRLKLQRCLSELSAAGIIWAWQLVWMFGCRGHWGADGSRIGTQQRRLTYS